MNAQPLNQNGGGGRRRRRNRRRGRQNKKKRRQQYERFQAHSLRRNLEFAEQDSNRKEQQKAHVKRIAEREQELLSRTIYVTHVLDLNRGQNLALLQQFFQSRYGEVEWCKLEMYTGRSKSQRRSYYPNARIQFRHSRNAERVFGGQPLVQARSEGKKGRLSCNVGYQGFIVVLPSHPYADMKQELDNAPISIRASRLSLGHWFITDEDEYVASFVNSSPGEEEEDGTPNSAEVKEVIKHDHWLEEKSTTYSPTLRINLQTRSVVLSFVHGDRPSQSVEDSFAHILRSTILGLTEVEDQYEISFRLKDISGAMEIYNEEEDSQMFALFIRLKHPPKVYKWTSSILDAGKRERCTRMDEIPQSILGSCVSYKLIIHRTEAQALLNNSYAMDKLRGFGIWRDRTQSLTSCPRTTVLSDCANQLSRLEKKLALVHNADAKLGKCLSCRSNSVISPYCLC